MVLVNEIHNKLGLRDFLLDNLGLYEHKRNHVYITTISFDWDNCIITYTYTQSKKQGIYTKKFEMFKYYMWLSKKKEASNEI